MRSTACDVVCALIDREAIGWTEAERLRVEQHLGDCPECSETLSLSRFVRDTLKEASGELTDNARSRAIRNALTASARRPPSLRVQVQKSWPRWTLGLGLSAAAAALVLWLGQTPETQVATRVQTPAIAPQESAPAASAARAPEQVSAEPVMIESKVAESRQLAHAEVRFAANTRARFEPATRTLSLSEGAVDVDVDPSKGESFAVVTHSFRVEVLGTRFSVTPEIVTVVHGRVRVLDAQGAVLIGALGAGESFSFAQRAERPGKGSKKPATRAEAGSTPVANAKALLGEARAAMVRDDHSGARALIQKAEGAQPSRNDRAEAATLRAELALLEGDGQGALKSYRAIAAQYGELTAGENAAFAAAQLAARSAPDEARALLEAYLTRYPEGRFVSQAKQRLERLGAR